MYSIVSSANSDSFTFSFSVWMSFIFCSWLIIVAWTSDTMLYESAESGHTCLVPDLRGKTFSFSPLSMMLAVALSYMAFIYVEVCSLYTSFVESFYDDWMLNFVKCFLCIHWDDHMIFILCFVNVRYHIYWFAEVKPFLHTWNESQLIMLYDLFNVLLNLIC